MTQTTILVVTGPLLIAALASLSLLAASVSLRSGTPVLVWAAALGLSVVQWLLLACGSLAGPAAGVDFVGNVIGLFAIILFAQGFRLRHGGQGDDVAFKVASAAAIAGFLLVGLYGSEAAAGTLLSALKALFFLWAATRTFASRFRVSPSEVAASGMLIVTATMAALLALGIAVNISGEPFSWLGRFHTRILVAGPASAATALFTILLIASDHSAERRRLVYTDPLTGLLNRLGFDALGRSFFRRRRRAFSVAIADIDHFKAINDAHGHAIGDAVLAGLAEGLAGDLRPDELAARIGGEEFVLLIGDRGPAAMARIEAMRAAVTALRVHSVPDLRITASFGVTEHVRGEPLERTIGRADSALYRSKHDGRNRATLAEPLPS